jgi:hypothetical protein
MGPGHTSKVARPFSNAKKNRIRNGVVAGPHSKLDAAQAVLDCVLQDSGHLLRRTAQMKKLEVVILHPAGKDSVQKVERTSINTAEIPSILESWPMAIDLGDGLMMFVPEKDEPGKHNELASKLMLICRGVSYQVCGKAIFMGVKNSKEINAPRWTEIVLKKADYVTIVFES